MTALAAASVALAVAAWAAERRGRELDAELHRMQVARLNYLLDAARGEVAHEARQASAEAKARQHAEHQLENANARIDALTRKAAP